MCVVWFWRTSVQGQHRVLHSQWGGEDQDQGSSSFYNRKAKKWHCPYCTTKPNPRDGRFDHLLSHAEDVAIRGEDYMIRGSMLPTRRPWLRHDVMMWWTESLSLSFGLLLVNWMWLFMVWTESMVMLVMYYSIYICLSLYLPVVYG